MSEQVKDEIRQAVRSRYAAVAKSGSSCCGGGSSCCTQSSFSAHSSLGLGYAVADMAAAPDGANMGLGCGNPHLIAALRPGEVVLDLGSGGGFDCFLASPRVGATGRVIGVDMTPDMISLARRKVDEGGFGNVEFRLGEIENLPVADGTVDIIISNCVINLSPDKPRVFAEAFRVLRPGGRLAISDVVAIQPFTESIIGDLDAYSGCVSGAVMVDELVRMLQSAGFDKVSVTLNEESIEFIKDWLPSKGLEQFVRSAEVVAVKSR